MSDDALSTTESPVKPGDVVAGKYRIEKVLGIGGMGVVVAGTHLELGQRVAIKFLLPQFVANPESAARFLREAQAAVSLTSDHAVRVHDVGRLDNGAPYMVMEFLEGRDLGEILEKDGALGVSFCIEYVLQAIDAVAEAHAAGIIHRDLKPSNLFLARRGRGQRVKVLDFGISKLTVETRTRLDLTGTSAILGSPYYMAPEQMRSTRSVDQRADIWSLGVILHELSTGALPFKANTITELCLMITQDTAPTLREVRAELPEDLEQIVTRCLQKDPAARFQTVTELAEQLEQCLGGRGSARIPQPSESDRGPLTAAAPSSSRSTGPVESKRPNADLGATGSKTSLAVTAQSADGAAFDRKPSDRPEVSGVEAEQRTTPPVVRRWGLFVGAALVLAVTGTALIIASRQGHTHAEHPVANEPLNASAPPSGVLPSAAAAVVETAPATAVATTEAPAVTTSGAPHAGASASAAQTARAPTSPARTVTVTPVHPKSSASAKAVASAAHSSSTFSLDRQ